MMSIFCREGFEWNEDFADRFDNVYIDCSEGGRSCGNEVRGEPG